MYSLLSSLDNFKTYLEGSSSKSLKKYMSYYDGRYKHLERDFYYFKISSSEETKKRIFSILKNLNIPESEWDNFDPNLTIYEFLLKLAQDGHSQIDFIIDLIDKKAGFSHLELVIGSGMIFSLGLYLLGQPPFQFIIDALTRFFSTILSFPILGLIFNIGVFGYYFYDTYNDRKKTDLNRFRDNFFLILSFIATMWAYSLLIVTKALMSPIIAGLFVAASAVDVLRELFCIVQESFHYLNGPIINKNDHLSFHREQARHIVGLEKRRNALGINFATAFVLVVITALWCFLPGGMAATICAISAIGIVYLIKVALLRRNEVIRREELQLRLLEIEATYGESKNQVQTPNRFQQEDLTDSSEEEEYSTSFAISPPPKPSSRQPSPNQPSAGERPFFAIPKTKPRKMLIDKDNLDWDRIATLV